jgi:hypothetical protein
LLLLPAGVRDSHAMSLGRRIGFLSLCALLMVAGASCDEQKTCAASAECASGEMCATAGNAAGPYYCLKDCTSSGECPAGHECAYVTNADCPVCDVITRACVIAPPRSPR